MSEWFFSAFAQSIGSIVAFIIAITGILFAVERQRFERRNQQYRESLRRAKDKYERSLNIIYMLLEFGGSGNVDMVDSSGLSNKEIGERIENNEHTNYPQGVYAFHVDRILKAFREVSPENDYRLDIDQLEDMYSSIRWLKSNTSRMSQVAIDFLHEMKEDNSKIEDRPSEKIFFGYDDATNELKKEIEEIGKGWTNPYDPDYRMRTPDFSLEKVTGKNYNSIAILFESLDQDMEEVAYEGRQSVKRPSYVLREITILSAYLILFGVIVPIILLSSIPQPVHILTEGNIVYIQVILIVVNFSILGSILDIIYKSTISDAVLGDVTHLSWFSKMVLLLLPRTGFPKMSSIKSILTTIRRKFSEVKESGSADNW